MEATGEADPKVEVASAFAKWDAAFNRGDAAGLAAQYAGDARLLPPTHVVAAGRADIDKFFAGLFTSGMTAHALEVIAIGRAGELVYSAAKWTAKGRGKDGSERAFSGLAVHVFERQADGLLKIKLHSFN